MAQSAAHPKPDPYQNFRFRIKMNNFYVAGFSKVSGIGHSVTDQTKYNSITLERGLSYDISFDMWCKTLQLNPQRTSDRSFRKELRIEVFNEAGQLVIGYNVHGCWISQYRSMSELDGFGNATIIESMVLENDRCEQDMTIPG